MLGPSTSAKSIAATDAPRFSSRMRSMVSSGVSDTELKPLIVLRAGETPGMVMEDEKDNEDFPREAFDARLEVGTKFGAIS